jgi:hypothetical protein
MLNKSRESGHPCLSHSWIQRKLFQFSPISMMLAKALIYIAIIMLRYTPSIPWFIRAFIMKGCWILSKAFLHLLRWLCSFCPCFCQYAILHLMICACWINPSSLRWNGLDQGVWCFWYVEFGYQYFIEDFCI